MSSQDYYKILGIAKDASAKEIQRAYRKGARKYHPDINKEKGAEEQFIKFNEANEVLKDPEKRKLYDAYGPHWQEGGFQQQGENGTDPFSQRSGTQGFSRGFKFDSSENAGDAGDFNEFFSNIFESDYSQQGSGSRNFDFDGRSHEAEITVSLVDIYRGTSQEITLQAYEVDNNGKIHPTTKTLQVKVPPGMTDGSVIRLAGQGEKGTGRGADGDLLLRVRINPDKRFRIQGRNLYTVVAVTPWEAALGTEITLHTIDGTVTLSVPKGSQNGGKLRLRGKGIPNKKDKAGDIIVELEIRIPENLSKDEQQLFAELSKKSKFKPREKYTQKAGTK